MISHTTEVEVVLVAIYLENLSLRIQEIPLEIILRLHNEIFNQDQDSVF